ncbi:MAG: hypothetical protein LUD02_06685 [Tannerellaceae bacterium]|nr:hypothetical protein [Tannerellaceae bacterium]MCD8263873.1 hypothetical protein [Tannerellaceae bacterium]
MELIITTPQHSQVLGEVTKVYLPGMVTPFTVLHNHGPLMSVLAKGQVKYEKDNTLYTIDITGGVVEVLSNRIVVITD